MDRFFAWKEEIMLFNKYCNIILFEYIFPIELVYYIIHIYLQLQYKYSIGNSPFARHTFIFNKNNIFFRSGKNKKGQLGLGYLKNVSTFKGDYHKDIITCSSGKDYTIILTQSGLYGTGNNYYGQLGFPDNKKKLYSFEKLSLNGIESYPEKIIKICCGEAHSIILTTEGYYVTGDNSNGEFGLGDKWDTTNIEGQSSRGCSSFYGFKKMNNNNCISNITQVACGREHSIILAKEGLFCTGNNGSGQLALGDYNNRSEFTKIMNFYGDVIMLSCGDAHTMILTKEGLFGSGFNGHGQLGIDFESESDLLDYKSFNLFKFTKCNLPNREILSIACGCAHTIILTDNGIYSCGYNHNGQLGYPDTNKVNYNFVKIDFSLHVIQLYCCDKTSMVLTKNGWYGCGDNRSGQLGELCKRRHYTFRQIVLSK